MLRPGATKSHVGGRAVIVPHAVTGLPGARRAREQDTYSNPAAFRPSLHRSGARPRSSLLWEAAR
jgi:hypothetical protein